MISANFTNTTGLLVSSFLVLTSLLSCEPEQTVYNPVTDYDGFTTLVPLVSIENVVPHDRVGNSDNGTKSCVFTGRDFKKGDSFSLWICNSDDYTSYNRGSTNIKVSFDSNNALVYSHDSDLSGTFSKVLLKQISTDKPYADIYAFAPHVQSIEDITNIPFEVRDGNDWMYAVQNHPDSTSNKNKQIQGVFYSIQTQFYFRHLMSLLEFNVQCKYPGSGNLSLSSINIKPNIYSSGVFNAIQGTVTPTDSATLSLPPVVDTKVTTTPATARVLLIPQTFSASDTLTFGFNFNGLSPFGVSGGKDILSFDVPATELLIPGDNTYGFKAGYRYSFDIEIENYLHFHGVTISNVWDVVNMPIKEL